MEDIAVLDIRKCLKTHLGTEWLRVIRTVDERRRKREEAGRKITAVDARCLKIAMDCLCGELAAVLSVSREEAQKRVEDVISGNMKPECIEK